MPSRPSSGCGRKWTTRRSHLMRVSRPGHSVASSSAGNSSFAASGVQSGRGCGAEGTAPGCRQGGGGSGPGRRRRGPLRVLAGPAVRPGTPQRQRPLPGRLGARIGWVPRGPAANCSDLAAAALSGARRVPVGARSGGRGFRLRGSGRGPGRSVYIWHRRWVSEGQSLHRRVLAHRLLERCAAVPTLSGVQRTDVQPVLPRPCGATAPCGRVDGWLEVGRRGWARHATPAARTRPP